MMKRIALFLFFALVVGMTFVSCSDDPRVAPKKIYIVDTDDLQNRVAFSNEYGLRVVKLRPRETIQLAALTNRLDDGYVITWSSDDEGNATVDQNGLVKAQEVMYGEAIISVSAPGVRSQAVCLVIVSYSDDDSDDPEMKDGVYLKINTGYLSGFVLPGGMLEVEAESLAQLRSEPLTFTWASENNVDPDRCEWFVDGIRLTGSVGPVLSYKFQTFGYHHVTCTAYRSDVFGKEYNLGSYNLDVHTVEAN